MNKSLNSLRAILPSLLLLAACSQEGAEPAAPAEGARPNLDGIADGGSMTSTRTPSPAGARVFFITPADGEAVSSPVRLEFGISGMEVVPAGQELPDSGHHHLIVDAGLPDFDLPVPADGQHIHFGDGRTNTELTLPPGEHTLQLLFADFLHIPHDPPVFSEPITITVE